MTDGLECFGPDPILVAFAAECPASDLVKHVLSVRSTHAEMTGEDRLRAILNAVSLAEIAARQRPPADVAVLAGALRSHEESDLAALALDAAAVSQASGPLAALAAALDDDGQVTVLLDAVAQRRLPADITDMLCVLTAAGQHTLAGRLLAALPQSRDAMLVVLHLRGRQRGDLADQAARTLAARLPSDRLAELAVGLRRHEDPASAAVVIDTALRQETGALARLILQLFGADPAYARTVVDLAVGRLEPADRLVLASLLEEGLDAATASTIWARIIPGLEDSTLVETVHTFAAQAGPEGAHRALREAAKVRSVARIAALVLQVNARKIEGGAEAIFSAVVRYRSIPDIDQLADQLRDLSWTDLAAQLLDAAIEQVHERAGTGDAAELIRCLLARIDRADKRSRDARHWAQQVPGIIVRVAQRHDPAHFMGLVDGLVRCGGYAAYRLCLEDAVAVEYDAADLARLPQVRGYEHLPVVLELMCGSLQNQVRLVPAEVPRVVAALRAAGAPDHHLATLMAYVGYRRDLDFAVVSQALEQAGLAGDADAVLTGHVQRRRGRRMRQPQFFSG